MVTGLRAPLLGAGLMVVVLFAAPAGAASGCVLGCNMDKKECIQTGRIVKLGCKVACRETATPKDLGPCMRGCTDTFRATKHEVCLPEHRACRELCVPLDGGDPDACLFGCGEQLATCARDVVTDGKACVQGCQDDPDRLGCLAGCGSDAEAAAAVCESQFTGCVVACDGGSPSGAFLE